MFGWQEVYFGTDMDGFFRKQNLLRDRNIKFKTKTVNNSLRLSMNHLGGRSTSLSRGGPALADYYYIYVKMLKKRMLKMQGKFLICQNRTIKIKEGTNFERYK